MCRNEIGKAFGEASMTSGKILPGTPRPTFHWRGKDGILLAGDTWGDPNGPLVILQHGAGQTRHAWKDTGARLGKEGYHAVAFDARGHGDSQWATDGEYSQDAMVEDLRCVVAALGARRPVLVGASMGGGTSLVAVGEGRVAASALILVDIAPRLENVGVVKIRTFMTQKPDGFSSLEEVAEAIASYHPQRERPANLDGLVKNVRLSADGRYHWHWDPRFMSRGRNSTRSEERLTACARRLTIPTLLVRGGLSDVLSEESAQEFLAMCPQSEYVNASGAGHMVAGDRNDAFGNAALSFLHRTVPASGEPGKLSGPPEFDSSAPREDINGN